jgi:MFS family permease
MGWTNPFVIGMISGGIVLLAIFLWVEQRVQQPLFNLGLFRIRAFAAGNIAGLLASMGRGGLQFMLVIWLQGIWLPIHGYAYADTPLYAGIYLLPLTFGFLISGPVSGYLSDRFGARPFATGGLIVTALAFFGLIFLPVDFPYPAFAFLIILNGIGSGLFFSPNSAGIMNSVPARQRGAAAGMRATFVNAGTVISIGVFFSLMIAGLASSLPTTLYNGLIAHDVPAAVARQVAALPPVSSLFGALLGYNPMASLLPAQVLASIPPDQAAILTGKTFFPDLISGPFHQGLTVVFVAAAIMALAGALASWLRGAMYLHQEVDGIGQRPVEPRESAAALPTE